MKKVVTIALLAVFSLGFVACSTSTDEEYNIESPDKKKTECTGCHD